MDDLTLLKAYLDHNDQEAFAHLVRRHTPWLYSAARRQLGDGQLAEDATQAVFLLLSQRANTLQRYRYLTGWLFLALSYCIRDIKAQRSRRQRREQEAAAMRPERMEPEATWGEIAPMLETAVRRLGRQDRDAVLLRFYEQRSLAEVGRLLGVSEEAARKRVNRAVDRLRETLAASGVEAQSLGLSALILVHAADDGPAGLVEKVMAGMSEGASGTAMGIAQGAFKMMAMAKVKMVLLIGAVLVAGGVMAVAAGTTAVPPGSGSRASEAMSKDAPWQGQFNQLYGLADGEAIKRIKPPFAPSRAAFWAANDRKKRGAPDQMVLVSGEQFTFASRGWGQVDPLKSVLQSVMGWNTGEIEGPADLLARSVPGDWVIRAGATEQEKLAGMLAILQRDVEPTLTIQKQQIEREVITARGKFAYQPHVDAHGTNQVILFSDPYVAEDGGGGGAGTLAQFLNVMGNCAGVQVVDQVEVADRPEMVSWHTLGSCWLSQRPKDPDRSSKLDSLLRNVAAQTGLSLIREKNTVNVWVVARKGG